jgi:hypothetical protein
MEWGPGTRAEIASRMDPEAGGRNTRHHAGRIMYSHQKRQAGEGQSQHDVPRVGGYGVTVKKKSIHDSQRETERVKVLREAFTLRLSTEQIQQFRFLDESGVNLGMTRLYGRAQPGQRVVESTSGYSGAHYSLVATLGLGGVSAPFMFEGAMNRDIFICILIKS